MAQVIKEIKENKQAQNIGRRRMWILALTAQGGAEYNGTCTRHTHPNPLGDSTMQKIYTEIQIIDQQENIPYITISKEGKKNLHYYGKTLSFHYQSTRDILMQLETQLNEYVEQKAYIDPEKGIGTPDKTEFFQNYMKGKAFRLFEVGKGRKIYFPFQFQEATKGEDDTHFEGSEIFPLMELKQIWMKNNDPKLHFMEPTDEDWDKMDEEIANFAKEIEEKKQSQLRLQLPSDLAPNGKPSMDEELAKIFQNQKLDLS